MTFRVPRCLTCSHAEADHASSRTRFPHPLTYGICRRAGCPCKQFVSDEEQTRAEHWLTPVDEDTAA